MTDSMSYCDIVLPAATHFEYDDLYAAYGHHWLQRAEPCIRPLGEALPNTEIFRRLAARFGFTDPCFKASDPELMDDALDAAHPRLARRAAERASDRRALAHDRAGRRGRWRCSTTCCRRRRRARSSSPRTRWPTGGADARLPAYRPRDEPISAGADLAGLRPAHLVDVLGAGGAPGERRRWRCTPTTRAARGLERRKRVRVWNDLGEVLLPLRDHRRGAAGRRRVGEGRLVRDQRNGQTISALVSADHRADLAEGACYNDTRVEVDAA